MNICSVSQFATCIGVTAHTLQRWDRAARQTALRTPTNRRFYTHDHLVQLLPGHRGDGQRRTLVSMRVSTQAQTADLANQREALEAFCLARGLILDQWIEAFGSGLNLKRPTFVALLVRSISGDVATIVVAHTDRLARFGVELVQHLCDVHGARLLILNTQTLSPEPELLQDLLAIVDCCSARLYGLRNDRQAVKKALADAARAQNPAQSDA